MIDQLRRSRRVLAVQTRLDRLAEWALIDLQSQAEILEARQHELIRFLSEEPAVAGIFSSTMRRRLQVLAEMLATIAAEQKARRGRHIEERNRLRHARARVAALESDVQHKDELRELAKVIETALQNESQACRKITQPF